MLRDFGTDISRTRFINTLYNNDRKAHFKRDLQFSNAVLVDVCEIFISSLKRWVLGKPTRSPSLYMAIVRIIEGCRGLIKKPFTKTTRMALSKSVERTGYVPAKLLFQYLSHHLTVWAVKKMYSPLDRVWLEYDLIPVCNSTHYSQYIPQNIHLKEPQCFFYLLGK